ncbi:MAG: hypothetical protein IJ467_07380 [Bacteroidaceae bacterium]|nr:hypothetical protein [Bacteroidaceae bacterium]
MKTNKLWQHSIIFIFLTIGGMFISCEDNGVEKMAQPDPPMTKPMYESVWEYVDASGTYKMYNFSPEDSNSKWCDFRFDSNSASFYWINPYGYSRSGNTITFTFRSGLLYDDYDYEPCLTRAILSDDNLTMDLYGMENKYNWESERLLMTMLRVRQ